MHMLHTHGTVWDMVRDFGDSGGWIALHAASSCAWLHTHMGAEGVFIMTTRALLDGGVGGATPRAMCDDTTPRAMCGPPRTEG